MPDFKTHLNALLESFGLDYENFINIPLNYQAGQQLSTSFTPTCDGFLILHVGCRIYGAFIADTVWGNKNVADVHNYNADGFATVNAIVHKGRTYTLNVGWSTDPIGSSGGLFVPFTYSRQKSEP